MRITWMAAAIVMGCTGGDPGTDKDSTDAPGPVDDTTDTTDTDEPTEPATCGEQDVFSTFPEDGEAAAYFRTTVEFVLDLPTTGAETVTLADDVGDEVAGSTLHDDTLVLFTPATPLDPLVSYTATLSAPGCDDWTLDFTTSEVGEPVAAADLLDHAWSFRLHEARWLQPESLGPFLQAMNIELSIGVVGVTGDLLDVVAATSEFGGTDQELCVPTVPFDDPVDYGESPYFSAGPSDLEVDLGGFGVTIDRMVVTGAFSPDATRIEGATLEGLIDLRPLVPSLSIAETPQELCDILALANIDCEPCSDQEPYCLDAIADSLLGVADDPIVVRTIDDVLNDPMCN